MGSFESSRECSDTLAKAISEQLQYRFVCVNFDKNTQLINSQIESPLNHSYQSFYSHKRTPSTRFMYHCPQNRKRQQEVKKSDTEGVLHRDKGQMETIDCIGWLHITITEENSIALIKLKHEADHPAYWNIGVP